MRVLVAGSAGQLGRALARTAPPGIELLAPDEAAFDILDAAVVTATVRAARPALIVNAAAYTAVDRAESDPERAHAVNADAAGRLAAAAAAVGARFVQVSTDFVFDGTLGRPYRPDDPPSPLSVYARSKLAGEQAVAAAHAGALIVRTAWVHAAGGQNFVMTMLRLMRERDEVRVVADQVGTPTHADSLASAIWALDAAGAAGIHHWTDAGVASWYDFALACQEEALAQGLLDRAVPVIPISTADYPTPARRPGIAILDKTATWAVTGPARHWRVELRRMLSAVAAAR
jgi:dTDP-4-dehydrorhamnose reductase